jgi:transcriptional regulator with XRE-family HTH domain
MYEISPDYYVLLGERLRGARKKAGLSLCDLGSRLGLKSPGCESYLIRLEKGRQHNIMLSTIVGYLKACNEPVGRFFLGLAENGVFGAKEEAIALASPVETEESRQKEARARAARMRRMRKQARKARLVSLKAVIEPIVGPYLKGGHKYRLEAYVELADEMLRAARQTMVRAGSSGLPATQQAGKTDDLKDELDRIEGKYGSWQLNPEAVHLVRMAMETGEKRG